MLGLENTIIKKKHIKTIIVTIFFNCIIFIANIKNSVAIGQNNKYHDKNKNSIPNIRRKSLYRSSNFNKLIQKITFLEELSLNKNSITSKKPPTEETEATPQLPPTYYEWLWHVNNIAIGNRDTSWMDGSDAKCKGFCSCVAGEILQRMIRERTQRKLQIGVDDVATPEHYMLKPLCNTGGTAIQIRNMEGSWEWQWIPAVADKFGVECWTPVSSQTATCYSKSFVSIGVGKEVDVFKPLRDRGNLKGGIAILLKILNKYSPERIFTENGNPDLTEDGEEVPVNDFMITSKFKREMCLNKEVTEKIEDRCRCTKSTCMKDIIELASAYYQHMINDLHDYGDSSKECAKPSFNMLDTHLDILSLIPPLESFKFDFLKMMINFKQGYDMVERKKAEGKKHDQLEKAHGSKGKKLFLEVSEIEEKPGKGKGKGGGENKPPPGESGSLGMRTGDMTSKASVAYYESGLTDFIASIPIFAWSGPYIRVMKKLDKLQLSEGPLRLLQEAIVSVTQINPPPTTESTSDSGSSSGFISGFSSGSASGSARRRGRGKRAVGSGSGSGSRTGLLEVSAKKETNKLPVGAANKGTSVLLEVSEIEARPSKLKVGLAVMKLKKKLNKLKGKEDGGSDGATPRLGPAPVPEMKQGDLGGKLIAIGEALKPIMQRFSNAITISNKESSEWMHGISNETMQDENTTKAAVNNIANSMFELLIRYGCTDYKFLKKNNEKLNKILPSIEMDGLEKEGTFVQKLYMQLIKTIDEILEFVDFTQFEGLQAFTKIGLEQCLEKCYILMENKKVHGGSEKTPDKFAKSKEMDIVQTCITAAAETYFNCAVKLEDGPENGDNKEEQATAGSGSGSGNGESQVQQQSQGSGSGNSALSTFLQLSGDGDGDGKSIQNKMSDTSACSFKMPGENEEDNVVDRPWKAIKKLHKKTQWEVDHLTCQWSEQPFKLGNPRTKMKDIIAKGAAAKKKKDSCDGVCPATGKGSGNGESSSGSGSDNGEGGSGSGNGKAQLQEQKSNLQQQEGDTANEQQQSQQQATQMAMLEVESFTSLEIAERMRCGCNGFDLPKAKLTLSKSQFDPLGTTPKVDSLDVGMPSGEDIMKQANARNNLADFGGQNLANQESSMLMAQ